MMAIAVIAAVIVAIFALAKAIQYAIGAFGLIKLFGINVKKADKKE